MRKITHNISFFVSIFLIITLSCFSCQKEVTSFEESRTISQDNYSLSVDLIKDVKVFNGILVFKNENVSRRVFNELNSLTTAYYNELRSKYEKEEEFESAICNGEITLDYVVENFEGNFLYQSMRNKLSEEEKIWLKNKDLDFNQEPDFIIADNILRSMLNENGEYIIGNVIYKIADNGVIYGVDDLDYNSLLELRKALDEEKKSASKISDKIFISQRNGTAETLPVSNFSLKAISEVDLKFNASAEIVQSYDDGNKYLRGRVTITNVVGISNFVKSETETYEYKGWLLGWTRINQNQWARESANFFLLVDGEWVHTSAMHTDLAYWESDKQAEAKYSTYPDRLQVASGGLQGWFKSDDVAEITKALTW